MELLCSFSRACIFFIFFEFVLVFINNTSLWISQGFWCEDVKAKVYSPVCRCYTLRCGGQCLLKSVRTLGANMSMNYSLCSLQYRRREMKRQISDIDVTIKRRLPQNPASKNQEISEKSVEIPVKSLNCSSH